MPKKKLERVLPQEDLDLGGPSLISGLQIHFNFLKKAAKVVPDKTQRDRLNNELATHIQAAILIGEKHGLLCKMRRQPILESLPTDVQALMSADERSALRKARHARNKLIDSHMRLVTNIATKEHRKASSKVQLLDLVQEGVFGLVRACEKFDPKRGFSFSTYAYRWIWQAILGGLSIEEHAIKLSTTKLDYIRKVERGDVILETPEQWSEYRGLMQVYRFPTSLSPFVFGEETENRLDVLADPISTDKAKADRSQATEIQMTMQSVLTRVPECERVALQAEFCLGWFAQFENKKQATEAAKYARIEQRIKLWIKSGEAPAEWEHRPLSKTLARDWYENGLVNARELLEG